MIVLDANVLVSAAIGRYVPRVLAEAHARGHFQELLNVPSRFRDNLKAEQWIQILDVARTREDAGGRFCFVKTVYAAAHRRLATPLVTEPCYAPGEGAASPR